MYFIWISSKFIKGKTVINFDIFLYYSFSLYFPIINFKIENIISKLETREKNLFCNFELFLHDDSFDMHLYVASL